MIIFFCLFLFGFDSKKMFDAVYKHFDVACISVLMLNISLRLVGLNIYFYDVFFLTIKWVQKRGIWKWKIIFTLGFI